MNEQNNVQRNNNVKLSVILQYKNTLIIVFLVVHIDFAWEYFTLD